MIWAPDLAPGAQERLEAKRRARMPKPFWASKTLWANGLALLAALAVGFGLDLGLTPEVQGSIVAGIMAVANIVLRLVTKNGVKVK